MLSFTNQLRECKLDNHYKIGQALKPNFNKRCPYGQTVYYADGKHPQWLYFIVCEDVQRIPPLKEFIGPFLNALRGDGYEGDENGEFSRQAFVMDWEGKRVTATMLSMVPFANHVLNVQGVSVDFWDVLAPVIGASKFNFRYLGDAPIQGTPTGLKTKHTSKRGHGKSPRVEVTAGKRRIEVAGPEIPEAKKGKKDPPCRGIYTVMTSQR